MGIITEHRQNVISKEEAINKIMEEFAKVEVATELEGVDEWKKRFYLKGVIGDVLKLYHPRGE